MSDFELTDELLDDLRESVRGVLGRAAARRDEAPSVWEPEPIDDEVWKQASELGWLGLLAREEHGGSEAGLVATLIVAEEIAAHLAVVPYLSSAVLAVSALELAG